ncbi:hypothetical protein GCM10028806_28440 [Spirosoma terrae]|uniref:Uncharacterized protein n=1 Tax=Spirosoma terrae TaxID=1968276 RepID=A0A6L9L9F4_9BACT|nr:hypothetical protein [Spirosoma terrae]NDU97196.1 hypothetical protein [Spirosoma terrae]
MNAIKAFFQKDNATAKLSGWLILLASLLTLAGQHFHFPPKTYLIMTVVAGSLTAMATVFKTSKVITWSLLWLLIYTVVNYLSNNLTQVWPEAQTIVAYIGGAIKLITDYSAHQSGDETPPTTLTK